MSHKPAPCGDEHIYERGWSNGFAAGRYRRRREWRQAFGWGVVAGLVAAAILVVLGTIM
jgi:hypothetical protein